MPGFLAGPFFRFFPKSFPPQGAQGLLPNQGPGSLLVSSHLCLVRLQECCNGCLSGPPSSSLHLLLSILHITSRICLFSHHLTISSANGVCHLCSPGVYSLINDPPSGLTGHLFLSHSEMCPTLAPGAKAWWGPSSLQGQEKPLSCCTATSGLGTRYLLPHAPRSCTCLHVS